MINTISECHSSSLKVALFQALLVLHGWLEMFRLSPRETALAFEVDGNMPTATDDVTDKNTVSSFGSSFPVFLVTFVWLGVFAASAARVLVA